MLKPDQIKDLLRGFTEGSHKGRISNTYNGIALVISDINVLLDVRDIQNNTAYNKYDSDKATLYLHKGLNIMDSNTIDDVRSIVGKFDELVEGCLFRKSLLIAEEDFRTHYIRNCPIRRIIDWNNKRGLLDKGYNPELECSFIIEELLELYGFVGDAKTASRSIINYTKDKLEITTGNTVLTKVQTTPQMVVDGWGDLIIFAIGALTKALKHYNINKTPEEIINVIMDYNDAKGCKVDVYGKVVKPSDFKQPDLT